MTPTRARTTLDAPVKSAARVLWDYHRLDEPVMPADLILGLGSYDPRVAEHAAALFLGGKSAWLLFAGGVEQPPERMRSRHSGVEAEVFRAIALEAGVPAERILIETQSTNTGENFRFTDALLRHYDIDVRHVLTVSKPFMERRALATAEAQVHWPNIHATSPPDTFEEFCFQRFDPFMVISDMVGDLQRLAVYPAKGYSEPQEIPPEVWDAFRFLAAQGFTERLIPGEPV
ncbi:MAG TPA: YdcF family protein [bacterium]